MSATAFSPAPTAIMLTLEDTTALRRILQRVQPDELYHLAGQSHVGLSFEIPETTCELTAVATLRLLEILRDLPRIPSWFTLAAAKFSASQRLRAPARPSIVRFPSSGVRLAVVTQQSAVPEFSTP